MSQTDPPRRAGKRRGQAPGRGIPSVARHDSSKRVTQLDVAKRAGVDRSTVSLALRGSPSLPKGTQEHIRKIATQMGYVPDPMLSALAAYRNRRRVRPFMGTVAWLVNGPYDWKEISMFREHYLGACERAPDHGYKIEVFELRTGEIMAKRMASVFRARNIEGILVCPQPRPNMTFEFPWRDFSAITFGYSLVRPQLDTVVTAQFRAMVQTMEQVRSLGYTRIGLMYSTSADERAYHHYLAAYLSECYLKNPQLAIPPIDPTRESLSDWFRSFRPEVLIGVGLPNVLQIVRNAGLSVPQDVAVASPVLGDRLGHVAGIYENSRKLGILAVDMVVAMINQGIRGLPDLPRYTLVDGVWIPGKSLPSLRHAGGRSRRLNPREAMRSRV